jgi:hypothetical protein
MRQHTSFREHFRRGNALSIQIAAQHIALLTRPPTQFLRTDIIPDRKSTHCGFPHTHNNICYSRPLFDATFTASQLQPGRYY